MNALTMTKKETKRSTFSIINSSSDVNDYVIAFQSVFYFADKS
jgi:hypothetical protein